MNYTYASNLLKHSKNNISLTRKVIEILNK